MVVSLLSNHFYSRVFRGCSDDLVRLTVHRTRNSIGKCNLRSGHETHSTNTPQPTLPRPDFSCIFLHIKPAEGSSGAMGGLSYACNL